MALKCDNHKTNICGTAKYIIFSDGGEGTKNERMNATVMKINDTRSQDNYTNI